MAQFALLGSVLKLLAKFSNDCASAGLIAENDSANCHDVVLSWIPDTLMTSLMMASREGTGYLGKSPSTSAAVSPQKAYIDGLVSNRSSLFSSTRFRCTTSTSARRNEL